jgi:hypothetical protein
MVHDSCSRVECASEVFYGATNLESNGGWREMRHAISLHSGEDYVTASLDLALGTKTSHDGLI